MKLKQTRLNILHKEKNLSKAAKTGVSLHCHTQYSKEMMDFIPHFSEKIPIVSYFWKKERENFLKREGKVIDFSTAYWSPPMPEQNVFEIEKEQINKIGLDAIVSITDHDCIEANLKLCERTEIGKAPISMEWTVPYQYGFFHIGVHNLPKHRGLEISTDLLDFTFAKERELKFTENRLTEILVMLDEIPEVLVVLNHPIWDIGMVGKEKHLLLLKNFINDYGQWIHAFEINGFRTWSENRAVIEMAESYGIPLVSGGDRHGCQPNTVLNLTNSQTFAEFVEEVRVEKYSEVVLMPEYQEPLNSRQLQCFSEILEFYPNFPEGRQKWFDRLYYDTQDGKGLRPLSTHWKRGGPTWLRWVISTLKLLGNERLRPVFRLAMNREDFVPNDTSQTNFVIPNLDDVMPKFSSGSTPRKTGFAS